MPTISGRTPVAAATQTGNILLGSQYELAPFDGTIEFGVMSSRAASQIFIASGPDILAEPGSACPWSGTAGTEALPKYPDDYHWEDEVAQGDRLKIILYNTDASNAAVFNWFLRITPA
jgi:hypothetical protein